MRNFVKLVVALGTVCLMPIGLVMAQTQESLSLEAYEACSAQLDDDAPDLDKWVFGQFCQSRLANPAQIGKDSSYCRDEAPRRIEGKTLVRAMEVGLPIRLGCAEVAEDLKLTSRSEKQIVILENSILSDLTISGLFTGISIEGSSADQIMLHNATVLNLINFNIEQAEGIKLETVRCNDFQINGVIVEEVVLKDSLCSGIVVLKDLDSLDLLYLKNVAFDEAVSIAFPTGDRLIIEDSSFPYGLEIFEPYLKELEFLNVTVRGDLSVTGKSREVDDPWCQLPQNPSLSTVLDSIPHATEIKAKGINVSGALDLSGLALRTLDVSGAQIGGRLRLWSDNIGASRLVAIPISRSKEEDRERSTPGWRLNHDAKIDLSYSDIGSIESEYPNSWCTNIGVSPQVNLIGADYDSFMLRGGSAPVDSLGAELAALLSAAPRFETKTYEPGPFAKLASVLDEIGADDAAREVRYGQRVLRHKTRDTTWAKAVDWAAWALMGYGIYPFALLFWFGGMVLLGWFVGLSAPALANRGALDRIWYSLENALPLVSLSDDLAKIQHDTWHRHFFHAQKILGFVLATVLVGALTLLGG